MADVMDDLGEMSDKADKERPKNAGKKILVGVLSLLFILAVGYVGAALILGERVPSGAVVAGVAIGGMSEAEAVEELRSELGPNMNEPLEIHVGDDQSSIEPSSAGLLFDVEGTVDALTGFTLDPRVLMGHLRGMGAYDPHITIDEPALESALSQVASEVETEATDGAIELEDGEAEITEPTSGTTLDVEATADIVQDEWLVAEDPIDGVEVETEPEIDDDVIDQAMNDIVDPLLSGPVSVVVDEGDSAELSTSQLTAASTLSYGDGSYSIEFDAETLADQIRNELPEVETEAQNATVSLGSSGPEISESVTGTELETEDLDTLVADAALDTDNRSVDVPLITSEPETTTEDMEDLGFNEVVVDFSTPLTDDSVRTSNLVRAAQLVNGTVVMPGEQLNLWEILAPVTAANGYVSSGAVSNGFNTEAMGGGISQMSTNMYNLGHFAGYDDIEHRPHTLHFDRYPAGREATLWEGQINMIWENNTPYGAMVEAWVSGGQVHTRLWSTPYWNVDSTTSEPYNYVSPGTRYNDDPECAPQSGGQSGYTVTVTRNRSNDSTTLPQETWTWAYEPWHEVICGPEPD